VGLPEIKASAYAVYDAQSGQMLASHKLNEHIEPASLTKLMTAYLVFKALQEGSLKLLPLPVFPFAPISAAMFSGCFQTA